MSASYFSPSRSGRPRIVNRQRGSRGYFRADIKVGDATIGKVERDSGGGGGFGDGEYHAYVHGQRITYARTLGEILTDLYEAQDNRELGPPPTT